MKILIASDIHGDAHSAKEVIRVYNEEGCERILLLGDLLYFGPRNELLADYNPREVIEIFNRHRDVITSVRGNCDAEVDQMVLSFPVLADYAILAVDGLSIFATHGHHHNTKTPPPLRKGEILLHGHTHIPTCEEFGDGNYYINPGSTTYPKGGYPKTYMVYENRRFTLKDFLGNVIFEKEF